MPHNIDKILLENGKIKISDINNKFRKKDCHANSQFFSNDLRAFDRYLQVPFEGVTAYRNVYDANLNIYYLTSTVGYDPTTASTTDNSSLNDCEMRQGFWKQININDDLGSEIETLKKEADDSKNQIRVLSESNTDMISHNKKLVKEYDSLKEKYNNIC